MITSVIGKTLLAEYNRRMEKSLTAEEFFDTVFHPVFYDHEKYMQYVGNSPYVQKYKTGSPYDKTDRLSRIKTLKEKIYSGIAPDASFAIGSPAKGESETTSGQVSNISVPLPPDDVFASWIGSGLSIGVQGGLCIYFNHTEILWKVYEGWQLYRDFLEEYRNLSPYQIDTWNGQWFAYACSDQYDAVSPGTGMTDALHSKDGELRFKTQQWTEVIFGIARKFPERQITGYVCSLGQTNKTIGFVPFKLPEISMPFRFYQELFGENDFLDNTKKIAKLYGTAHPFRVACQKGAIGVSALEPKDLKQYMTSGEGKAKNPDFAKADEERRISFNVYQTWLLAMLNNKEFWQKANNAAAAYLEYVAGGQTASRERANALNKVLEAPSKRKFIEASSDLVKVGGDTSQKIYDLVEEVNALPDHNFPYFQTLIKFHYAFLTSQTTNELQGENE